MLTKLTKSERNKLLHFILLVSWLFLLSCENDLSLNPPYLNNYFPLAKGNSWTYYNPFYENEKITYKIIDKIFLNHKTWYLYGVGNSWQDTLRVDELGRVRRFYQGKEIIWLDVTRPNKSTYTLDYKIGNDTYIVYVKRNVEIKTSAGHFKNCIDLFFDIPRAVDDEHGYILAPGVGIVKIYGAWTNIELLSYQISF
jgi:hypothetical protein